MAKKRLGAVLCLAAALMMAGCQGGEKTQNPAGAPPGQVSSTEDGQQENSIMGKVTAIDERGETKEASAEDVEEGTFVRVMMDGDTAVSVTILRIEQKNREGGNETEK